MLGGFRFKTLYRILEGVDRTLDIHRQSTPRDELLERLRDYDGPHYVLILDEVDQLQDKDVLYDLYRTQGLTMILIANREEDVFGMLDDRLNSRLQSCARIHFKRYSLDELVTILGDRVEWGLEPDVIGRSELKLIADCAAGDARQAIGILRKATQLAVQDGRDRITDDLIPKAVPKAKQELQQKTAEKLTDHQEVLYEIIVDAGTIGGGEVYELYSERVDDPMTRRTVRNYLAKLEQYNLVDAAGNTKARTYSPIT